MRETSTLSSGYQGIAFTAVLKEADEFVRMLPTESYCAYCGDHATQWDHVVPQTFLTVSETRTFTSGVVPCCQQCNGHLSNMVFESLDERLDYVGWRVKRKHKKIIESPDWSDAEIKELGPGLRRSVKNMADQKRLVANRLRYLERGTFKAWFDVYATDQAVAAEKANRK